LHYPFNISLKIKANEPNEVSYFDGEMVLTRYPAELKNNTPLIGTTADFQTAQRYYYLDIPPVANNTNEIKIYNGNVNVKSHGYFEGLDVGECGSPKYKNPNVSRDPFDVSLTDFYSGHRIFIILKPHLPVWIPGGFELNATVYDTGKVKKSNTATIVLAVLGSLVLLAVVIAVGFVLWRRSKRSAYKPLLG